MDILLPGISNLVEGTSFGILALINGIALPSPTTLAKARAVQHVPLIMTLVERLVHIIGDTIHNALISELGVCNASPLSTAISYAGTSHHVAHIVLFIPLVPNTVHDTIIGGADFLVGSHRAEAKFLVSIIVLSGSTPLHVVSPSLRSTVSIVAVVVQEGEVAQSTVGIATTCLDQNILLSTEGVSPVLLKVGSGAAPEVPICAAFSSARVESPPVVGERQNTGFSIRIATICLGHSYFLAADSIAQTSTKHLLAALCLQPLHTQRIHHSIISYTVAMWLRLGLLRLRLVQRSLHICEAGRARSSASCMQGCVPFTFPFTSAVTSTDALKQVSPVILLAPSVPNSVGSLGVLVIAPISGGTGDAAAALPQAGAVHHHPALVGLLPGLTHHIGCPGRVVVAPLGQGLAGPLALPIAQAHALQQIAACLMRPTPGIADLVGLAALMAAIGNGAADSPTSSSNASTVPDHGVLGALISLPYSVSGSGVFVKASLFRFGLAFAVKPSASTVAGTNQRVPQVNALPLLVYLVVPSIVKAGLLALRGGGLGHRGSLRLPPVLPSAPLPVAPSRSRRPQAEGEQRQPQPAAARHPRHGSENGNLSEERGRSISAFGLLIH